MTYILQESDLCKFADVFDIKLTLFPGVYKFYSLPKCGEFLVCIKTGTIKTRYLREVKFSCVETFEETLWKEWCYWKEIADIKGCPYTNIEPQLMELCGKGNT